MSAPKAGDFRVPNDTRLYLDLEIAAGPPEAAFALLTAALNAGPVASVLIRPAPGGQVDAEVLRALVSLAKQRRCSTRQRRRRACR